MSIRICVPNLVAVRRSCRRGGGTDRQTRRTELDVIIFGDNAFPRPYTLEVVSHPNIACTKRMSPILCNIEIHSRNTACIVLDMLGNRMAFVYNIMVTQRFAVQHMPHFAGWPGYVRWKTAPHNVC